MHVYARFLPTGINIYLKEDRLSRSSYETRCKTCNCRNFFAGCKILSLCVSSANRKSLRNFEVSLGDSNLGSLHTL